MTLLTKLGAATGASMEQPRVEMGDGFWIRLCDALMLQSEPAGTLFGGINFRTSKLIPDNMAVLIDHAGEITIIDMRTEAEKARSLP